MTQKDIIEFKLYNNRLFKRSMKKNFSLKQTKEDLRENKRKLKSNINKLLGEYNA